MKYGRDIDLDSALTLTTFLGQGLESGLHLHLNLIVLFFRDLAHADVLVELHHKHSRLVPSKQFILDRLG